MQLFEVLIGPRGEPRIKLEVQAADSTAVACTHIELMRAGERLEVRPVLTVEETLLLRAAPQLAEALRSCAIALSWIGSVTVARNLNRRALTQATAALALLESPAPQQEARTA